MLTTCADCPGNQIHLGSQASAAAINRPSNRQGLCRAAGDFPTGGAARPCAGGCQPFASNRRVILLADLPALRDGGLPRPKPISRHARHAKIHRASHARCGAYHRKNRGFRSIRPTQPAGDVRPDNRTGWQSQAGICPIRASARHIRAAYNPERHAGPEVLLLGYQSP